MLQISPTECVIAEYCCSPKPWDERWWPLYYQGEVPPGGGVRWSMDLPPAECRFRRDEPGMLPWGVDDEAA